MTQRYLSRAMGWKNWNKRRIKMIDGIDLDVAEIELERAVELLARVNANPDQYPPNARLSAARDADRWRDIVRLKRERIAAVSP